MAEKDSVGFLPKDIVRRTGTDVVMPLHIARDIAALLSRQGKDAEYYAALLRDGINQGY